MVLAADAEDEVGLVRQTSTATARARISASRPSMSRSKATATPWPMRRAPAISMASRM